MEDANNLNMPPAPHEPGSGTGSLMAIILVLAVIIVGALYFWNQRGMVSDEQIESIKTQESSDETSSIEADLETTNTENVDYDLDESNFNAS